MTRYCNFRITKLSYNASTCKMKKKENMALKINYLKLAKLVEQKKWYKITEIYL